MSSSDSSFSASTHTHQYARLHKVLDVDMQLTLLLGLLLRRLRSRSVTASGSTTSSRSRGRTAARSNVQKQILDILALEGLREELRPDGLDFGDFGGRDEGLELVGLDCRARMSVLSSLGYLVVRREGCAGVVQ